MLLEATLALLVARLLVAFGLRSASGWLFREQADAAPPPENLRGDLRAVLQTATRHVPWESICLPTAIAGKLMLLRRGCASTIRLGVGHTTTGDVHAHAWLDVAGVVVTGADGMSSVVPLPSLDAARELARSAEVREVRRRLLQRLLLLAGVAFLLLRFVHLAADYPRNVRWDDGITTDEGWYASAAIDAHLWGQPLLPGDMNIPVLMPVWSAVAAASFAVGGFGIVPLRAAAALWFLACVGCVAALLRRFGAQRYVPLAVYLLAVNPWSFAFSRSSFLEYPMLTLVLLAVLLVPSALASPEQQAGKRLRVAEIVRLLAAGVCFAAALLLKTTALTLAPVLLYVLLAKPALSWRTALRCASVFGAAGALYGLYWRVVIVPHIVDVHFYLGVVKNTLRLTPLGFLADASRPFRYGLGSDHLLFALSLAAIPGALLVKRLRVLWRDPLFDLAAIWLTCFMAFMVKHNNDPTRYYATIIPALVLLAVALLRNARAMPGSWIAALYVLLLLDAGVNALQVSASVLHPAYTMRDANAAIADIVRAAPEHSSVVMANNAHELALYNGLRPLNLLFHSNTITQQADTYQPGWWVQFAPGDDGSCFRLVLAQAYTAERRGEWQVYYPGSRLVLWKLTRIPGTALPAKLTPAQTKACTPPVW